MGLWQRIKQLTMTFPTRYSSTGLLLFPKPGFNYKISIGEGRNSSLIMACCFWAARTFPEAPARVTLEDADGHENFQIGHTLQRLLARPNDFYSGIILWMATLIDFMITGNAYWIKIRSRVGDPVQIWWAPCGLMEPIGSKDSKVYIDHYDYKPDPNKKPIRIEVEDVVHFRFGLDPDNPRKGLSQIASLLKEVFTDEEAASFSASLLRNLGVPGVILNPTDPDVTAAPEDVEEVKEEFMARFSGDKRGQPLVMRTKTDVKVLSFSPQQMDLRGLRRIPEERVTAIFGMAAIVVGFGAGLDRSTFANFAEARTAAYEQMIAPTQRLFAQDLTTQLLDDFEQDPAMSVVFDISKVRILQEDENRKWERFGLAFTRGTITRAESRQGVGMHHDDSDEVYLIGKNQYLIARTEDGPAISQEIVKTPEPVAPSNSGSSSNGKSNGYHHDEIETLVGIGGS